MLPKRPKIHREDIDIGVQVSVSFLRKKFALIIGSGISFATISLHHLEVNICGIFAGSMPRKLSF